MRRPRLESFRTYILRGLLAFLPLALTIWVLQAVIRIMDQAVNFIPKPLRPEEYLPVYFPGLGAIFTILMLWLIGFVLTHFISNKLTTAWDQALRRIPFVRGVYSAVAQLVEAIFSESSRKFRNVVLIEYPRKGVYTLGLVTGETQGELCERTAQPMLNVFIPTTPNPTSGWYLVVPESEAVKLDMNVEEAFKLIISGGIVVPDQYEVEEGGSNAVVAAPEVVEPRG